MSRRILFLLLLPLLSIAAPKAPSDLKLVPSTTSVDISWKDNSNNETGFKIFRDGKLIHITKENVTRFTDSGLVPNTTYKYTIKATDDINYDKLGRYTPKFFTNGKEGDGKYIAYYPQDAVSSDIPVVIFIRGGGHTTIEEYSGIMQFLASKGYFVLGVDVTSYESWYVTKKLEIALNEIKTKYGLKVSKLAILGHSLGGGQTFYAMKKFQSDGYGTKGNLILSIDGWFAFNMDEADLNLIDSKVAFLQMNGIEGTGTDPRINLKIWELLKEADKSFYILPSSDHSYIKGNLDNILQKRDLLFIIGALVDDAFRGINFGAKSIPQKYKTSYKDIFNALKPEDAYTDGDCKGKIYNAIYIIKNNDIDYCDVGINDIERSLGAREVAPTDISKATMFAAVNGDGDECSKANPCNIQTAFSKLSSGDVLFLRGGVYKIDNRLLVSAKATKSNPIIIESYPGEQAVIEGRFSNIEYAKTHKNQMHVGIKVTGSYIHIRKIEIRYMGHEGLIFRNSSNNLVEGCNIHHNMLSGIVAYGGVWKEDDPNYLIPYRYGYNTIRDNIVHHNSDVGLNGSSGDGGNADGITILSGKYNKVIHNTVYANSDDGIDTWRSNDTYIAYNISYDNGRSHGDGNGIKAGGNLNQNAGNGLRSVVEFNIAYNNKADGFDFNAGKKVKFRHNTSYNNGGLGFQGGEDTIFLNNIAAENSQNNYEGGVEGGNNSWNIDGNIEFMSTDPHSKEFLKPTKDSGYSSIGAVVDDPGNAKIFIIGDSTVHNHDVPDGNGSYYELGWGDVISELAKEPENIFNRARSGASSKSYKVPFDNKYYWQTTKTFIKNSDIQNGAFLLIQFGHNDEHPNQDQHTDPGIGNSFYNELKVYVDEAREMGVVPVLITPVQRQYKEKYDHKEYAQTMRDLAQNENVMLLDLTEKSFIEFSKYPSTEAIYNKFGYDDHTHFSPTGAKIVASWIKELACKEPDKSLCDQFK